MADIFISYATEDKERVRLLAQALADEGWSVFWDRSIKPGQYWQRVIGQELKQARCIVVAWSPASVKSNWVLEEAGDGRKREALIPLTLDKVEIPFGFAQIQSADFTGWKGDVESSSFRDLLDVIVAKVGRPAASQPGNDLTDAKLARFAKEFVRLAITTCLRGFKGLRRWLAYSFAVITLLVAASFLMLQREVPAMTGLPLEAAEAMLSSEALRFHITESGKISNRYASLVVRQAPGAGTRIAAGAPVELTIDRATAQPAAIASNSSNDQALRRTIVGTWRVVRYEDDSELFYDMTVTYSGDGRYVSEGIGRRSIVSSRFTIRGKWQIDGGRLSFTVVRASYPANLYYQPGYQDSVEILAITDQEIVTRDLTAKMQIDLRVK